MPSYENVNERNTQRCESIDISLIVPRYVPEANIGRHDT